MQSFRRIGCTCFCSSIQGVIARPVQARKLQGNVLLLSDELLGYILSVVLVVLTTLVVRVVHVALEVLLVLAFLAVIAVTVVMVVSIALAVLVVVACQQQSS